MPYGNEDAYKAQDILGGVGKYKSPNEYSPYKMQGHELPGPNQYKSPATLESDTYTLGPRSLSEERPKDTDIP